MDKKAIKKAVVFYATAFCSECLFLISIAQDGQGFAL